MAGRVVPAPGVRIALPDRVTIEYLSTRMLAEGVGDPLKSALAERDLFRQLLELGAHDDFDPFVSKALALAVEAAGARHGYLEVQTGREGRDYSIAHATPPHDPETFRKLLSSGVMAEAIATGTTVNTASAATDPRFRDRASVRENHIQAVLCVPIGRTRPLGVVYLQGRELEGPFTAADQERLETFARHIEPFIDRLTARQRLLSATDATVALRTKLRVGAVVGRSKALARVLEQVAVVAPHRTSVLLDGPTGTGKTQLAWIIHENSPRADQRFVELNCAALPETLLENELFGSVPGAHSTASVAREGKVTAAHGGTLFLDEIAELSLASQSKLLQLLQSGTYYPLGSSTPRKADVRIIAATNRDLRAAIADRTFREDLFYRLNVLPVRLPALSERVEDVLPLARHFCAQSVAQNDLETVRLSPGAIAALETAEWPGNIRQLANVVEAGVLRAAAEGLDSVEARHVMPEAPTATPPHELSYQQHLQRFRRQLVTRTLAETDWNVTEAARRLDVARSYLNRLIRSLALERD